MDGYANIMKSFFLWSLVLMGSFGIRAQTLVMEPQLGLQHIYPQSFLGEDRSYSQVAAGLNVHSHHQWIGLEINAIYAHNRLLEGSNSGVHAGGGLSFRLNDGWKNEKVSAYLSGGYFFNHYSSGWYASLRMRAPLFSYGFRYQIETGDNSPPMHAAMLTLGMPFAWKD